MNRRRRSVSTVARARAAAADSEGTPGHPPGRPDAEGGGTSPPGGAPAKLAIEPS